MDGWNPSTYVKVLNKQLLYSFNFLWKHNVHYTVTAGTDGPSSVGVVLEGEISLKMPILW